MARLARASTDIDPRGSRVIATLSIDRFTELAFKQVHALVESMCAHTR